MAGPPPFVTIHRATRGDPRRDPKERVRDHREIISMLPLPVVREQAHRCMQCGVPFCQRGCPLGNAIPDWNALVHAGRMREAIVALHATNDFPEFTGFTCPAPCEPACTLEINDDPVMIKHTELSIIEHAFREGWVIPEPPAMRTGKRVAVVGSGPAGLAAASQLNRAGHRVVVYERDAAPGGLLRFGIPDCKLEKHVIDRRVEILAREGIAFRTGVDVGRDVSTKTLRAEHDAVVLAVGARTQRPLEVPGATRTGVHLAMDYLYDCNRGVADRGYPRSITAAHKRVIVVGGGDTAADCIANAHRERARQVIQLDRDPPPSGSRPRESVGWPNAPRHELRSYALEEGGERRWQTIVTEIMGDARGHVTGVRTQRMLPQHVPIAGSDTEIPADLVLVAIGFTCPERDALLTELALEHDDRGNVHTTGHATHAPGLFVCGDARRGASLVVWAIREGRDCAAAVDAFLRG